LKRPDRKSEPVENLMMSVPSNPTTTIAAAPLKVLWPAGVSVRHCAGLSFLRRCVPRRVRKRC
jgi:hypothetical protein